MLLVVSRAGPGRLFGPAGESVLFWVIRARLSGSAVDDEGAWLGEYRNSRVGVVWCARNVLSWSSGGAEGDHDGLTMQCEEIDARETRDG